MAQGLNNSWGVRTELDPNRQVSKAAMPQALASRLHYQQKKTAQEIYQIPEDEWQSISKGVASRDSVADYMRAYEHYQY